MCKLLAIVDIENEDRAIEFSELAIKPMTARDDDGLGIIMLGEEGLGVERWLKPSEFPKTSIITPSLAKYAPLIPCNYNYDGSTSQQNIYALGVHSRMATGPKTLANVHPFVKDGIALIHNGVISNHHSFEKTLSSCDSEALLSLYLEHDVKSSLANVQKIVDAATGWYAFMVFNPESQTVDIIKDERTTLFFAHVAGVGMVFCTTEEIIKGTCGRMKVKQSDIYPFPGMIAMRWSKDKTEVEAIELTAQPAMPTYLSSVTDVSKEVDVKCVHGVYPNRWCHACDSSPDFMKAGV